MRYGTAEAVPYKDWGLATQALQPAGISPRKDEPSQAETCATKNPQISYLP
jgi:hypothetical protein